MSKSLSVFWRLFLVAAIVGLGISTIHFQKRANYYQAQLEFAQDTLTNILSKDKRWLNFNAFKMMDEREVGLGDSLIELHRIAWATSRLFVVQVEVYPDSTVCLRYKRGELDIGNWEMKVLSSKNRKINWAQWQVFHQKISNVSFLDAVKNNNYMCCFLTGSLHWEAVSINSSRLEHSTRCRQSGQFAEACEYIFQFFDDPELEKALKNARQ
ncbi:MAG: hypothetical protein ACK4Q5_01910 [Saprospiraceae bacterium]